MAKKCVNFEDVSAKNSDSAQDTGPNLSQVETTTNMGARGLSPLAGCGAAPHSLPDPPSPENLAALARLHGPLCLDALADEARSGSGASRVSAAKVILEHGFGKAGKVTTVADDGALPGLPPLPDTLRGLLETLYGPAETAPEAAPLAEDAQKSPAEAENVKSEEDGNA